MTNQQRYWEPEIETAPLDTLASIQLEKLKALIARVYENSTYYRRKFDQIGLKPQDIQTLDDFRRIPPTEYTHDIPPEDLLTIPLDDVVNVLSSSGTTGWPKMVYVNGNDSEAWINLFARFACLQEVGKGDVLQMSFPFPQLLAGYMLVGARVIPFTHTSLFMDNQIRVMAQARTTVILSGPGYFLTMVKRANELGIDLKGLGINKMLCGGESMSQTYRKRTEEELGMKIFEVYGMVEVGHPAGDCSEHNGLHTWEDLYITEIVDPDTGKTLPPGQPGEIILTPLWREAMPFIRYRTGDVAMRLEYKPCSCGRTFPKISQIKGRTSQAIKVGDVTIYPVDVEEAIYTIPELTGEYQVLLNKPGVQDELEVTAECHSGTSQTEAIERRLESELNKITGVRSKARLLAYGDLSRGPQYKAQRIIKTYEA